jgi:hypothetical protein
MDAVMALLTQFLVWKFFVQPFVLILRCYAVAIAFFVALAETEWEIIFRLWQVLFFLSTHFCSWISLYLVQAPVGVETAIAGMKLQKNLRVGASS